MNVSALREAGVQLGERLAGLAALRPVVIGLAHDGVPVAHGVSVRLAAPLDVMLIRRLRVRGRPDLEAGMVSASVLELDDGVFERIDLPETWIRSAVVEEMADLRRRERIYRHGRARMELRDRTVVLVDDAFDDADRIQVAIRSVRRRAPARVIVAAPVQARGVGKALRRWVDDLVVLEEEAGSARRPVRDHDSLTDAEVIALLR